MTCRKAVLSPFSLPRLPSEQEINSYCARAITHYKVCLLQRLAFPTSSRRHPHVMTLAARTGIPHLLWKKRFPRMAYPPKNYFASLSLPSGGPRNWQAPNCYLKPVWRFAGISWFISDADEQSPQTPSQNTDILCKGFSKHQNQRKRTPRSKIHIMLQMGFWNTQDWNFYQTDHMSRR